MGKRKSDQNFGYKNAEDEFYTFALNPRGNKAN